MEQAYEKWRKAPTQENMAALLDAADPVVDSALSAYARGDKALKSRARILAAGAFKTYDPQKGTKLRTHVMTQLQPLSRAHRERTAVVRTPERVAADSYRLSQAQQEFADRHGREPSTAELADASNLSLKRIAHVRGFKGPLAESSLTEMEEDSPATFYPGVHKEDPRKIWQEYVYHDLDPINQQILERKAGMHGKPALSNNEIAAKLGVTPGAVSQRSAAIAAKLAQGEGVEL